MGKPNESYEQYCLQCCGIEGRVLLYHPDDGINAETALGAAYQFDPNLDGRIKDVGELFNGGRIGE